MLREIVQKVVFLLLSSRAMADVQDSLYTQLSGERGVDLLLNIAFATVVGLVEVSSRGKNPNVEVENLGRVMLSRFFLSLCIGILVFALTEAYEVNNWMQFAAVGLASWGGTVIPDTLLAKWQEKITGERRNDNQDR